MLTPRGWSILLSAFFLLAFAMLDRTVFPLLGLPVGRSANRTLELLGLTLGGWVLWEWLLFALRVRIGLRRLRLERELLDERGPIDTLWTRRTFKVRVVLRLPAGMRLPYVRLADHLPYGAAFIDGVTRYEGAVEVGQSVEMVYRLRCTAIGVLRFEGMRVQLADPQGFFYHAAFVPGRAIYRVLPPLADAEGHAPSIKRHNLLPPPGVHRLRRPGSGSELLDLRDYLPGDPPKTIAWKASARRDRLITKEFESEVPLRCTLFVDLSQSVRLGHPGENVLTHLIEIAAGVAQANAAERDLTGLCLFDEKTTTYVRPARGPRHLVQVINLLTDAAARTSYTARAALSTLLPLTYAFAERVYPDLLRPALNHAPEWLAWLAPQPAYTMAKPTAADRLNQWLPLWLLVYLFSALGILVVGLALCIAVVNFAFRGAGAAMALVVVGLVVMLLVLMLIKVPAFFFPGRRRLYRWRKQLAALLSARHGLAPGGLSLLMEDEVCMLQHLQRFLAEHRVPFPLPRYDEEGKSLFLSPEKLDVLAGALLRSITKGHDNEMFVLLVDLLELPDRIDPLLAAVKVAVARHHQVMVVCPWPTGVPLPGAEDRPLPVNLGPLRSESTRKRWHLAFQQVRRAFARLRVPVVCTFSGAESSRLILDRLDRLRMVGGKR